MGDTNTGADEHKDVNTEGEGNTGASDQKNTSDDKGADSGADADNKGDKDSKDDKSGDDKNATGKDDNDAEPPTRNSRSRESYILARKTAKEKKDADKNNQGSDGGGDDDGDTGRDDGDDDIDPMDKKIISNEVQKAIAPLLQKQEMEELKSDVSTFISANPDFKPFEAKILKFAQHPSRKQLPISSIAYEVAGPELMKIGADRAKKADDDARSNQAGGGGSARGGGGTKSVADMTVDEFKAHQQVVLRRRSN